MSGKGDITNPQAWVPAPVLVAVLNIAEADLTWALIQDSSYSNIIGWNIHRKTDSGSYSLLTSVGAGVTSYADSTIASGHTYTYYIEASWPDLSVVASNRQSVTR